MLLLERIDYIRVRLRARTRAWRQKGGYSVIHARNLSAFRAQFLTQALQYFVFGDLLFRFQLHLAAILYDFWGIRVKDRARGIYSELFGIC